MTSPCPLCGSRERICDCPQPARPREPEKCHRCLGAHASPKCDDGVHHGSALPYPQVPARPSEAESFEWTNDLKARSARGELTPEELKRILDAPTGLESAKPEQGAREWWNAQEWKVTYTRANGEGFPFGVWDEWVPREHADAKLAALRKQLDDEREKSGPMHLRALEEIAQLKATLTATTGDAMCARAERDRYKRALDGVREQIEHHAQAYDTEIFPDDGREPCQTTGARMGRHMCKVFARYLNEALEDEGE